MRSLRNTRSAGDDQIKAELLKSTPDILHELLADIRNRRASPRIDTRYNNANTEAWKAEKTRPELSSYYAPIDDKQSPCRMHEETNC